MALQVKVDSLDALPDPATQIGPIASKGEYDKVLTQQKARYDAELASARAAQDRLRATLEKVTFDEAAMRTIAAQRGIPELVLPALRSMTKVVEAEDGTISIKVVTDGGAVRPSATRAGSDMTLEELVAEMRAHPSYSRAFEPTGARGIGTGGGASSSGGGGAGEAPDLEKMSFAEYKKLRSRK